MSTDNNKKITKVKLSKKFVKGIKEDLILPTVNWDDFLEDNWCYIYPNNGTEDKPANVVKASRYILENPYPGYIVGCIAEVLYNGNWGTAGFIYEGSGGYGVAADMEDDHIVVTTGRSYLNAGQLGNSGGSILFPAVNLTSLPCRVKIYKIGKIKR